MVSLGCDQLQVVVVVRPVMWSVFGGWQGGGKRYLSTWLFVPELFTEYPFVRHLGEVVVSYEVLGSLVSVVGSGRSCQES